MIRKYLILFALSITMSCRAQFYSLGDCHQEKRTEPEAFCHVGIVDNVQREQSYPDKSNNQEESLPSSATTMTAMTIADFKQRMVDLWTSVSMPLDKMRVTSKFGMRFHPIYHKTMPHNGMDFGVPVGTKVYAMMDGVVKRTGYDNRSGNFVVIDHGEYTVSYCHLSKILVKVGEKVKAGQTACLSGDTGYSTAPHTHIALKDKNGKWCNPQELLDYVSRTRKKVLAMIQEHGGLNG